MHLLHHGQPDGEDLPHDGRLAEAGLLLEPTDARAGLLVGEHLQRGLVVLLLESCHESIL